MSATPLWVKHGDIDLHAWVHTPPQNQLTRGAVLICPPIGVEHLASYLSLRCLADQLSDRQFMAVRFDYPGTGDSTDVGSAEGMVENWTSSIRTMVAALRAGGAERVILLGHRMGAVLAANSLLLNEAVDAALFWDPWLSGREFARAQRVFLRMIVDVPDSRSLSEYDLPGVTLDRADHQRLTSLTLVRHGTPIAPLIHIVVDPKRTLGHLADAFPLARVSFDEGTVEDDLFDAPPGMAGVPLKTITKILRWTDGLEWESGRPVLLTGAKNTIIGDLDETPTVTERDTQLGPFGLSAIVTEPTNPTASLSPTVLFLDAADKHHIGPSRLWVELARDLAREGFHCVRFDFSGQGDTPVRYPSEEGLYKPGETLDLLEAIDSFSGADRDIVLVGLCSGAYYSLEIGGGLGVTGICAINPWSGIVAKSKQLGPSRDVLSPKKTLVASPRRPWVHNLTTRPSINRHGTKVPGVVWGIFDRLGILQSPARGLLEISKMSSNVLILCGEQDAGFFEGRPDLTRRAQQTGRFRFEQVVGMDHSLLLTEPRERAKTLLHEHIVRTFLRT